jgi:hypothetical protein
MALLPNNRLLELQLPLNFFAALDAALSLPANQQAGSPSEAGRGCTWYEATTGGCPGRHDF